MSDWLEAEQRIERAQQFFESQRWEEALAELEIALSINPNNASWHAQRGSILDELDRMAEAAEAYEEALRLEPEDHDVALALGITLNRLGRHARAIEVLEGLAAQEPTFEPAYCHRIHAYAELGLHDRAEEMFYLAQQLFEGCPHCFYFMGSSLAAHGKRDRAVYCWKRTLDLDPLYLGVNERIARAYRASGDLKAARKWFLREIRNDPGNTALLFEYGQVLIEDGDIGAGAAKFAQIIELDPEHTHAHYALGTIWLGLRQPERALACFDALKTIDDVPDVPDFHLRRGEALLRLDRGEEARRELAQAVLDNPSSISAAMLMGECLLRSGQASQAADSYRKALALDDRNVSAHHKLGLLLVKMGQSGAGLNHCLRALELKDDYVPAAHTAALAHLRMANWKAARDMLRRAIQADPTDDAAERLLSRITGYRVRHVARSLKRLAGRLFAGGR